MTSAPYDIWQFLRDLRHDWSPVYVRSQQHMLFGSFEFEIEIISPIFPFPASLGLEGGGGGGATRMHITLVRYTIGAVPEALSHIE